MIVPECGVCSRASRARAPDAEHASLCAPGRRVERLYFVRGDAVKERSAKLLVTEISGLWDVLTMRIFEMVSLS